MAAEKPKPPPNLRRVVPQLTCGDCVHLERTGALTFKCHQYNGHAVHMQMVCDKLEPYDDD